MPFSLLFPRHWHTWFGLGALRLFECLPYPLMLLMGRLIGRLARLLIPHYVKVARCNMRLCLPDSCLADREKLLSQHFEGLGITVCESAMTWWSSNERICKLSSVEGLHHLQHGIAQGHGVILLTAHFTTLEIGARILNAVFPINALYRPLKNPVLAWMAERSRSQHARRVIRRDDVRGMVRALKNNECVWYAPDQSYRKKGAAMVPFFGVPAATNVSTSRLAKLTGAVVLLYSHERLKNGAGYRVVIHPAMADYPSNCAESDAERFNHFIEDEVRRIPEQYWWIHRRFKGLTPDYPDYYRVAKSV